jgi:lysophospholipase L1-like esterase
MATRSRRARAFCPTLDGLEGRVTPSGAAANSVAVELVSIGASDPAAVPAPSNSYLTPTEWLNLHAQYVSRAVPGRSPVVFLGDSMFYFWGDPATVDAAGIPVPWGTSSWESVIARDRAADFGIPGDRTGDLLWRVQNGELSGRPRVAVVEIGINNIDSGQTAAQTAGGIAAVVRAISAASPRTQILLLSVLPTMSADPASPLRVAAAQVNAMISGLAGGRVHYLDVSGVFLQADGTFKPGLVLTPSVHPTLAGYQALAAAIQPEIQALLTGNAPRRGR